MANFNIAWAITAQHESSNYDSTKNDSGNIYKGVLYGSKYGITATFLIEKLKMKNVTPALIKNLTYDQAGQYAKKGVWDSIMNGDAFQNQEVANLVFDWLYQRYGTAISLIGKLFKQTDKEIRYMLDYLKFTNKLIAEINNTKPEWAYVGIQQARYKFTTESGVYKANLKGVKARVQSFNAYQLKDCMPGRGINSILQKNDLCADDSYLNDYFFGVPTKKQNSDNIATAVVWGIGLYAIYRIFK